jgi:hypothetical protein
MKIWLLSFFLLLLGVETYQGVTGWIEHLTLPLPVLLLTGVGLAIASNTGYLLPSRSKAEGERQKAEG